MAFAAPIISPTALKKWGSDFRKNPVGTGPFRFVKWIPKDRAVLEKNTKYWGKKPYLDRIVFKEFKNETSLFLDLKTNAIHGADQLTPKSIKTIEKYDEFKIVSQTELKVSYLAMNVNKKPFDNVKVRRAVNYAINKKKIVKFVFQGRAIPAKSPLPPHMWGYDKNSMEYEYNPRKAKALLKQAGYKKGFKTTLSFVPRPSYPKGIDRLIKANLKAVGIKVKVIRRDWKAHLKKTYAGEHDMAILGWTGDNGDPDNFLYILFDKDNIHKGNISFFGNPQLHKILINAQQTFEVSKRANYYRQAQKIILEQAPWVPLAHATEFYTFHKKVHGVSSDGMGIVKFHNIWIE